MRIARLAPLVALFVVTATTSAAAQSTTSTPATAAAPAVQQSAPVAASPVATARDLWMTVSNWITKSAEQMSDSDYAYQPTRDVRTLGAIYAHVADAQYMFCAMALGEKAPVTTSFEKTAHTKAEIVAALKASNDYCAKAYAISEADAMKAVGIFGTQRTHLYALTINATHDNEHYGNIVTYTRLRGHVPPSSQQQ